MAAIRLRTYSALSLFITSIVIANAANHYQQFYPTVVNLVNSKLSRIVLINDAILMVVLFGMFCKSLFFGTLRTYEEEKTWENAYVTLIETCLALTIFRGEMSSVIFGMFVSMLFLKIFHWIAQMRVQYIESLPTTSKRTFFRLFSLVLILLLVDGLLSYIFINHWLANGPTVRVLFLTEYLIMSVKAVSVGVRLMFHAYNLYKQYQHEQTHTHDNNDQHADMTPGWESHNVAIFYLDIIADLLQSGIYIAFFLVIMSKYGLPIHLIRDIYIAIRSAKKRIMDLINYRRLVNNLDQRFPDATPEELAENNLCVVCREELRVNVKRLPCGHLFHSNCLRGWLEQTQECPTCRAPVDQDAYNTYARERGHNTSRQSQTNQTQRAPQQPTEPQQPVQPEQFGDNIDMQALYNQMMQQSWQPYQFNPAMFTGGFNAFPTTIEQQQEQLLDDAAQVNEAQNIMTNMYIQYLEMSKVLIEQTLQQLKDLQQQQRTAANNGHNASEREE